eukprot:5955589-Amphidinium_carterae.1
MPSDIQLSHCIDCYGTQLFEALRRPVDARGCGNIAEGHSESISDIGLQEDNYLCSLGMTTGVLQKEVTKRMRVCIRVCFKRPSMSRTQTEQLNSELDQEKDKTVSENGNPQTLAKTI